jgi:hypothetical protein
MRNCARRHVQKIVSRWSLFDAEKTSFPRGDILVPPIPWRIHQVSAIEGGSGRSYSLRLSINCFFQERVDRWRQAVLIRAIGVDSIHA